MRAARPARSPRASAAMPVAEHEPPDRRRGSQQRGPVAATTRPPEPRLDRVDHAVDLGDARLVDVGGAVEPFAPRGEVAERADRVATGDQRPDVRASGAGAGRGPRAGRRARPSSGRGRAPTGCADRRPRRRRSRSRAGRRAPGRPGRGRRSPLVRAPGRPASPSSAKISGDRPAGGRLDALVEVDERRAMAVGQPSPDDALATPRAARRARRPSGLSRPRRSRPRPCRSGRGPRARAPSRHRPGPGRPPPARRPPATGASGVAAMRAR